ncbi:MAG: PRC-barrel domain-containing protein [bacterium]|nr:PRC-barrel domain-containing protein [bacterium]
MANLLATTLLGKTGFLRQIDLGGVQELLVTPQNGTLVALKFAKQTLAATAVVDITADRLNFSNLEPYQSETVKLLGLKVYTETGSLLGLVGDVCWNAPTLTLQTITVMDSQQRTSRVIASRQIVEITSNAVIVTADEALSLNLATVPAA